MKWLEIQLCKLCAKLIIKLKRQAWSHHQLERNRNLQNRESEQNWFYGIINKEIKGSKTNIILHILYIYIWCCSNHHHHHFHCFIVLWFQPERDSSLNLKHWSGKRIKNPTRRRKGKMDFWRNFSLNVNACWEIICKWDYNVLVALESSNRSIRDTVYCTV